MQVINLDLSVKLDIPFLQAKQGDVGRKFQAVITDGGTAYNIPSGTTLSVWYSGTSGEGNYSEIGLDDDFCDPAARLPSAAMLSQWRWWPRCCPARAEEPCVWS